MNSNPMLQQMAQNNPALQQLMDNPEQMREASEMLFGNTPQGQQNSNPMPNPFGFNMPTQQTTPPQTPNP